MRDDSSGPDLNEAAQGCSDSGSTAFSGNAHLEDDSGESDASEIQHLRSLLSEGSVAALALCFLDFLLRSREIFFEQINQRRDLPRMTAALTTLALFLTACYGFTMGIFNGYQQALSSAVKLPLLFLLTAAIWRS